MARDLFSKYLWLIDTIKRHGRITREEINKHWRRSRLSDGTDMPRRTFCNYRQAIEELFGINIECDTSTYEYYISERDANSEKINDWLLNSSATNNLITSARDVADRIFLEDAPSAREFLPIVIETMRSNSVLKFDYHPYTRSLATRGVFIEPYFAKIFKQRWYVIGRNIKEDRIKTYALDRMSNASQQIETFVMPEDFDPSQYFDYAFGIIVDKGEPRTIKLKVEPTQAKYFRALPLHHSQEEMLHDQFSIFQYKMRITDDLVNDLLSYGSRVTVLEPRELRTRISNELKKSLASYNSSDEKC